MYSPELFTHTTETCDTNTQIILKIHWEEQDHYRHIRKMIDMTKKFFIVILCHNFTLFDMHLI